MFEGFEIPVIETYTQLAGVLAVLAVIILAVWLPLRAWRRKSRRGDVRPRSAGFGRGAETRTSKEFDAVASFVTERTERAVAIEAKQAAAAVKIDSTEIAVERLKGELAEVMRAPPPRRAPPVTPIHSLAER